MGQRERKLRILSFRQSVPAIGVCERCGITIRVRDDLMITRDKAREQFHLDFANHECKPAEDVSADRAGSYR